MENPFSPGFGRVPKIYLGREGLVDQVVRGLDNPVSPYQTSLVYGMRGVGKTAFLTDVSRLVAEKPDWVVVDVAMGPGMLDSLIGGAYLAADNQLRRALRAIEGVKFSAFGLEVAFKPANQVRGYQLLLEEVLKAFKKQGKKLLITVDEVKPTPEVVSFASIYQSMIRKEYRLALMMTGLPNQVTDLQNSDVLTFLLRSKRIVLGDLDRYALTHRYDQVFTTGGWSVAPATLNKMWTMTMGYAYAFQLFGYLLWERGGDVIDEVALRAVHSDYLYELSRNAYSKVFQGLTAMEQRFVMAMVDLGGASVSISDVRKQLEKNSSYVSVYRRRLIEEQVIKAAGYGRVAFTRPLFADFIKEYQPELH